MKKSFTTYAIIIIVVLAIVAVALIYWHADKMQDLAPVVQESDQKAEMAAKERAEKLAKVTPREKVILQPVEGFKGYGEGRVSWDGENYMLVVEADLEDPKGTDFYEGWLVRESPFESLSTGKMKKNPDGLHEMSFQSKTDLRSHDQIVITLEKVFDDIAEAHVLEGSF